MISVVVVTVVVVQEEEEEEEGYNRDTQATTFFLQTLEKIINLFAHN